MAGSIMEGLGSSVTGNINKAMLIVFSGNERKTKKISTAKIAEKAAAALGKTSAQVKAAWSRLTFSGKATPPKELGSSAEVKKMVAANPNAVGYIEKSAVDGTVKVLLSED